MKIFYLIFIAMILCSPACHSAALPSLPCDFYGEGTALNIGSTLEAKDPEGVSCGSFFVNSQAKYGFMSVYPDLVSTLNIDEGASENDTVTFYLNSALLASTAIWHSGSSVRSDVSAGMEDTNLEAAYQFLYNQMDKYIIPGQENTPRLIESFADPYPYIPQNPTHPPVLIKEGFVYDNALTMIAFLVRGQADDMRRARLIGEAFVGLVSNDSSHDGRIRDVYYVDLSDPNTFHKPTFYGRGSGSGNLAWVMNALIQYCKREWNQEFFDTALELANFVESNYRRYDYEVFPTYNDNLHVNAYKNGYIALSDGSLRLEPYVVTEHNVVLHAAFMRLYELMKSLNMPGYADWYNRAMVAKDFVISGPPDGMWRSISPNSQLYLAGTRFQKVLDANTHAIMAFNEADRNPFILNWIESNLLMTHDGFTGFAYDDTKIIFPSMESGIWFEGTGYMSVVYQMMNDIPSSNFYLSQIESSQFNNPSLSNYGAIPTACHNYVDTYFYDLFRSPHIAATASYVLAKQGYNVLWTIPSGVNTHPVADAGDNTSAAISEPLSLNGSRSWDPNNDALAFDWQITAKPQGSNAALIDSDTATPALTPDKQGAYEIQLVVSDYDAQSTPDNVTITVEGPPSDSEAPQASNVTPVDGTYTPNKRQSFHADLSDNVGLKGAILFSDYPYGFFYPVMDMVLSGNTASIDYTPSSDIEEGWHLYHLYTSDTSDNYTVAAISFIVDSIAPNVANITPLNGTYTTNRRPSFHADVSDANLDYATLRLDQGQPQQYQFSGVNNSAVNYAPNTDLSYGTHQYFITIYDKAGNFTSRTQTFTVYYSGGGGGGGGGCFLAGTSILMADRTTKPIEDIKVGDKILAFDETTNTFKPDKIKRCFVFPEEPCYLVINDNIKVTPHHRFYIGGRWVEAGSLKLGDKLLTSKDKLEPITSIGKIEAKVTVYNLEVNPYHTFIANNVVVHNASTEGKAVRAVAAPGPIAK